MDTKKIFVFLLLGLFMISFVSAWEFDNVKSYDPITREATIKNAYGLGDTIGKARLNTPLNVKVGAGYQKVAEFDLWAYEDYNDALKQFTFIDMKNKGSEINRDYDLKYKTYEEVKINKYGLDCYINYSNNSTNSTKGIEVCNQIITGSHFEKKQVWKDISATDFKKDLKLTIGVFTNVQIGDHIDWIPTIYGTEVEEWAEWQQSLNVNLENYWKLDENDLIDELGNNDLVNFGTTNTTGIIGDGRELIKSEDDYLVATSSITGDTSVSGMIWFKTSSIEDTIGRLICLNSDGATSGVGVCASFRDGMNGSISVLVEGFVWGGLSSIEYNDGDWHQAILTISGTDTKLYIDNVLESTTSGVTPSYSDDTYLGTNNRGTGNYYFDGDLDEGAIWSRVLTSDERVRLYNGGNPPYLNESGNLAPNITLNSPSSANYTSTQTPTINLTAWDDINLSDVKLYVNDILNQTNASGINNTNYIFDLNLGDGDYTIYGKATDNESEETNSSSIRIVIDSTLPTITSAYNLTDLTTFTLPINSTWHYNATDEHLDSCYYNSTANATQTVITCNSTINTLWTTQGNKTITYCANDTFGLETCNTEHIYIYYIQETQAHSPDPIAESFDATFNLTINLTNIPTTTATLVLNDTIYTPTTTAGTNGYYFEAVVTIPDGWGNTTGIAQDWFWNYTINGVATNELTDTENITVYKLGVDNCSVFGELIFDFSILDEEALTLANESETINVEADLVLTSKSDATQLISYSNVWSANNNPQICVPNGLINNSQYWIDLTVGFSSTDHVWEFFYIDSGTLNSTKTYEEFNGKTNQSINLLDLLTADSTSFLFNYFNIDGLAVDGSVVHVMRKYIGDGKFREVERAKADQNGDTIVHLVEEDVIYYFIITLNGELLYTSSEYTALCQTTPCTIQLEASGDGATFPIDWDLIDGGAYDISSDASTREVSLTYSFNESDTINLTIYKYNSDGSYSAVETASETGTSGSLNLTVPQVAGNVSFFARVDKGEEYIDSEWVDFEQKSRDYIGITLGLLLSALIILLLGLISISEGAGTIGYVILGVFVSGALGLLTTELSTGVSVTVYLIIAGAILLWKFTRGRN